MLKKDQPLKGFYTSFLNATFRNDGGPSMREGGVYHCIHTAALRTFTVAVRPLNQLVRDYLLRVTGSHEAKKSANEFARLATSMPGRSDEKTKFSRNSIYDRQALK